jgi:hypothetical protein
MSNDIELIPAYSIKHINFFKPGGLDKIIEEIKEKVKQVPRDISTPEGRSALYSLCRKIGGSLIFVNEVKKSLTADRKKELAEIDAEGRRFTKIIEDFKEEIREPLTKWEEGEQRRKNAHEVQIQNIKNFANVPSNVSSEQVKSRLKDVFYLYEDRKWEEYQLRADEAYEDVLKILNNQLQYSLKQEALEVERQRKLEIEKKKDYERILEIDRKKLQKIANEKVAAKVAKAEEEIKKEQIDKLVAISQMQKATDKAEKLEIQLKEIIIERIEAQKREANSKHRKKIEKEIHEDLIKCGYGITEANHVIDLIKNNEIRHLKIEY